MKAESHKWSHFLLNLWQAELALWAKHWVKKPKCAPRYDVFGLLQPPQPWRSKMIMPFLSLKTFATSSGTTGPFDCNFWSMTFYNLLKISNTPGNKAWFNGGRDMLKVTITVTTLLFYQIETSSSSSYLRG